LRSETLRRALYGYLALLLPIAWLAMKFDPYALDGDGMAYMDVADLIRAHHWPGVVNAYWHPLYPTLLALAQAVFHTTRANELHAYYILNYVIFLASVVAMLAFVAALVKLRRRMTPNPDQNAGASPLLSMEAMQLLGIGLLVIATGRELSMATIRPDALLQALMLAAFAMLLQSFASESLIYAPAMGFFFGLAYLTKSFAFLIALLTIALMMVFHVWVQRRKPVRVLAAGALALIVFAAIAGPYIGALSEQKHRFDFGDSGALNYAWYVSGTVKMHIEPSMTPDFGSAKVNLIHPEQQLLAQPGIYSYRAEPYGTYPAWFDPTYFHEHIVPVFNAKLLLHRDVRNVVLSFRYLLNHPEAWILLALLLTCGARFGFTHARTNLHHWRHSVFWLPPIALGLAIWGIYGLVNIEERYVTLAYLLLVLPIFAALVYVPNLPEFRPAADENPWPRRMATAMVAVFAFLALGETLRVALDHRRNESGAGLSAAWVQPNIVAAAKGLNALGVGDGDEIACMGTIACLNDPYWMRLANVRVLTEVYNPDAQHLLEEFEGLPNRQQVEDVLKAQGAKVVVAAFDPGEMTGRTPASAGWIRLGESDLYAYPLTIAPPATTPPTTLPWDSSGAAKP
jgi:4-amino-4-deoxy-L-arabinose transferase-like glycosyltransferase